MVRPLEYNTGLNLNEAEERYREINDEFERVKSHYSGFFGRFRRNLREEDDRTLTECMGVLLPLSTEASVQQQIGKTKSIEDTLFYKVGELNGKMLDYLATFKNTGVTRLSESLD